MPAVKVLYEDNHLIAVVKPAGILSQGDETGDSSMIELVKAYLKEKYKKPGNVFLGLLHRLDRPVSGVMLFAKTSKGAARLSMQFRDRTIEKTYTALVVGKPQSAKGVLISKLGKDTKTKKAKSYEDGKEARLHYQLVKSNGKYSLLEIKLDTGKFHQIRAQLSEAGLPIVGDVKYKGPGWDNSQGIALCATSLTFCPATSDTPVKVAIDIPEEWKRYLSTGGD